MVPQTEDEIQDELSLKVQKIIGRLTVLNVSLEMRAKRIEESYVASIAEIERLQSRIDELEK